ncbi:MAG: glycosyltransferase [Planctomycetota bacterium]
MPVSVVIPCYNGRDFIAETLESVLSQTTAVNEILVVDDGSTDDSASIVESFGTPVRLLQQPNQGESVARNRGIEEASSDWIAFLDADDLWLPDKLEKQLAAVDDSRVVAVHTNVETFGTTNGVSQIQQVGAAERYKRSCLAAYNCFITPSSLIVRKDKCPRFAEWTQRGEDMLFALDLVAKGEIRLVNEPLTRYRRHPGGQSADGTGIIDSHAALLTWLDQNAETISERERREIDCARLQILIQNAWSRKARRDWGAFWRYRVYLEEYAQQHKEIQNDALDVLLGNRIFPAWIYRLRDLVLGSPISQRTESY